MLPIINTLLFILQIVWFVVIAHVIMSWLINFGVLNVRQPLVYQLWSGLNQLLEPLYRPIRNLIPLQGIDLSPIVVIIGIFFLQQVLYELARTAV